nr:hypothetical protein [Mycolicibacterium poriferae]
MPIPTLVDGWLRNFVSGYIETVGSREREKIATASTHVKDPRAGDSGGHLAYALERFLIPKRN